MREIKFQIITKMSKENKVSNENKGNGDLAIVMRTSFWFMRDNHTFYKPKGNNLDEVKIDLIKAAKDNPYGMVCSVIILEGEKEVRRVGENCRVDRDGNVDIDKWYNSVIDDEVVRGYDGA